MTEYVPPPDCPNDSISNNRKLKPFEVTFEVLNRTIQFASEKFENGHWTENELVSCTSSHNINKLGSKKITDHCHNKMAYILYEKEVTNTDRKLLKSDHAEHPDEYCH